MFGKGKGNMDLEIRMFIDSFRLQGQIEKERKITMVNQRLMRQRVRCFLNEIGMPITKFCERVSIGRTTYYEWMDGDYDLKSYVIDRMDQLLARFNY